ncbi:MAG: CotH kinase family protein [Lachnospiraceae bacterium]|nr:CotH kinase family protein [Lachnospiraceae bacterium]
MRKRWGIFTLAILLLFSGLQVQAETAEDLETEEPWMTNEQAIIMFLVILVIGLLIFAAYRIRVYLKEKRRVARLYGADEPEDGGTDGEEKDTREYWGNGLYWDGDSSGEKDPGAESVDAKAEESEEENGETNAEAAEQGTGGIPDTAERKADAEPERGGEATSDRKNRKKRSLTFRILLSVLIVFAVFAAGAGVSLLQNYFTEQALQKAATSPDSGSTTGIVFDASYAEAGVPLTVSLAGISGEITSCLWYVGSRIVGNGLSYTPTEDDLESIIMARAEVSLAGGGTMTYTTSLYYSKLPVVNLTADSAIGEEYVTGTASFGGSADYPDGDTELYSGGISIKLRGNSTKYRAKQPYKIKLDSKADLYGMGENKHWVLLANDIDHTQIRNMLVNDFSAALGMESMSSVLVSLFLNGEYVGVYQLCEQIRVDETRVDIFDWDALAGDAAEAIVLSELGVSGEAMAAGEVEISSDVQDLIDALETELTADYSWITEPWEITYQGKTYTVSDFVDIPSATGGFLLEMDFYALGSTALSQITTAFSQPFYFSKPDNLYTNNAIREYAANYIQSFEYALHSDDYFFRNSDTHYEGYSVGKNSEGGWKTASRETEYTDDENDGKHYTELFDLDSLVQNFFVCEFSMNWDSMKNSVFITKDVDSLAKISPVWDFDWAFGNKNMYWIDTWYPESWQTTNEYFTTEQYYQSVQWNRYLIKDPYFLLQIYDRYDKVSALMDELLAEGGTLDRYEELLNEACAANDAKWSYSYSEYGGETYEAAMDSLREFITVRAAWLDEQFESFETLRLSLGAYEISDMLHVAFILREDGSEITIYGSTSDLVREEASGTGSSEKDLSEDVSSAEGNVSDDSEGTWEAWQGARSGSGEENGEAEESEEESSEGSVIITACVSDASMVQVSFQVNGTWICCADVDESGYATVTVPADVLNEEGHNMVQIRGVDADGNYVKPELDETDPDSTDPYSNYSIF